MEKMSPGNLNLVRWIDLSSNEDSRGILTSIESGQDIPFELKRIYYLHNIKSARGGHAHRDTYQMVIALRGNCEITLSDGKHSKSFILDNPNKGLCFGPMLWIEIPKLTSDSIVLVLASTHYDKNRSIRTHEEYLNEIG